MYVCMYECIYIYIYIYIYIHTHTYIATFQWCAKHFPGADVWQEEPAARCREPEAAGPPRVRVSIIISIRISMIIIIIIIIMFCIIVVMIMFIIIVVIMIIIIISSSSSSWSSTIVIIVIRSCWPAAHGPATAVSERLAEYGRKPHQTHHQQNVWFLVSERPKINNLRGWRNTVGNLIKQIINKNRSLKGLRNTVGNLIEICVSSNKTITGPMLLVYAWATEGYGFIEFEISNSTSSIGSSQRGV